MLKLNIPETKCYRQSNKKKHAQTEEIFLEKYIFLELVKTSYLSLCLGFNKVTKYPLQKLLSIVNIEFRNRLVNGRVYTE